MDVWLRWAARALSCAVLLFIIAFLVGEWPGRGDVETALKPRDLVLALFLPLGLMVGLALGWRWEIIGGATALASMVGFYAAHLALSGGLPRGPWFAVLAVPGLLFLLAGLASREHVTPG